MARLLFLWENPRWKFFLTLEGIPLDPETLDAETENAAGDIISQMPDVQEHAIASAEAERKTATPPPSADAKVDDHGTAFDPELHTGSKLKNGRWREKRKKPEGAKSFVASTAKPAAISEAVNTAEAQATGMLIATMMLGACQSMGGEEWEPTQQERDFQVAAWQAYCVSKNMTELSPGWGVVVAFGSYAGPRFAKPKTAAKLSKLKSWIVLRVAKAKLKRALKARGVAANVEIKDGEILVNGKTRAEFEGAK